MIVLGLVLLFALFRFGLTTATTTTSAYSRTVTGGCGGRAARTGCRDRRGWCYRILFVHRPRCHDPGKPLISCWWYSTTKVRTAVIGFQLDR
uniref:Putative secreted protein n=1 Tax=Anopheles darlingi TaxID=43151 RepID=A0A2M4DMA3_ANODA